MSESQSPEPKLQAERDRYRNALLHIAHDADTVDPKVRATAALKDVGIAVVMAGERKTGLDMVAERLTESDLPVPCSCGNHYNDEDVARNYEKGRELERKRIVTWLRMLGYDLADRIEKGEHHA